MIGFVYADKSSAKTLLKKVKAKKGLVSGTEKNGFPKNLSPYLKQTTFQPKKRKQPLPKSTKT